MCDPACRWIIETKCGSTLHIRGFVNWLKSFDRTSYWERVEEHPLEQSQGYDPLTLASSLGRR
jgi:hypothetical protein